MLAYCARRLDRREPTTVAADVLQTLPASVVASGPFDSIALNFVLHCLPRSGGGKQRAIENLVPVLADDGVLFGATILGDPTVHRFWSRPALAVVNRRGVFDNLADDKAWLRSALTDSFTDVSIDLVGSAALFTARGPIPGADRAGP